jgi:hypothetical protein
MSIFLFCFAVQFLFPGKGCDDSDWNLEPTCNSICIFQFVSLGCLFRTRQKLFAKIFEMYEVLKENCLKSGFHLENHLLVLTS